MLRRCIIIKPAGRQPDPGLSVDWYDVSYRDFLDTYFNTGDSMVFDSSLKITTFDKYYDLNIDKPVDDGTAAEVADYDCMMLRASNYIHPEMDWTNFLPWLERLQVPVLCCGIGAQSAKRELFTLPEEHQRLWKIIGERTPSIGVRGEYSAEVLNSIGVKNVEIVGCPTLFRGRTPNLPFKAGPVEPGAKVSFSVRRETGYGYTDNAAQFLDVQKDVISHLNDSFDLYLTAHGEVEEKLIFYKDPVRLNEAISTLRRERWFNGPDSLMEKLYYQKLFFATRPTYVDEFNKAMAASIGYRVHGVLPSLAMGTPAVLLAYDTRSVELANALDVPLLSPEEALYTPTDELFDPSRFSTFLANFPKHYARMKEFIERNHVSARMK